MEVKRPDASIIGILLFPLMGQNNAPFFEACKDFSNANSCNICDKAAAYLLSLQLTEPALLLLNHHLCFY